MWSGTEILALNHGYNQMCNLNHFITELEEKKNIYGNIDLYSSALIQRGNPDNSFTGTSFDIVGYLLGNHSVIIVNRYNYLLFYY